MSRSDKPDRPSEVERPRIRYVPGLDGLRGAAVLVVLAFHLGHLRGGYLGVDLFFVLSGFLITSLLLAEGQSRGRIGLARFWERRARRLLPALAVMLVAVAAYARLAARPEELHRIRWDGVATLLYLANWRAIFGKADYWALFTAPSPLEHTWSLAIEEQFYLVWPLVFVGLVALASRRARRAAASDVGVGIGDASAERRSLATLTLGLSVVLGALSLLAAAFFQWHDGWNRVYFGTDTRAFAILAGAAVAASTARFGPVSDGRPRRVLEIGGLASAGVLGAAWVALDGASWLAHHGGLVACSVAGAVVIAAVVHPTRGPLARVFSFPPLRWMGLISYGIYLYHWPLIVWLSEDRTGAHGWQLVALQFTATIVAAVVSYKVVEQPIRHSSGWRRRTNVLVPAAGFAAVALLVVAVTITSRVADESGAILNIAKAEKLANQRRGPRILVIGNSVAYFLGTEGLGRLDHEPQLTVLDLALDGCSEPATERFRKPDGVIDHDFGYTCDRGWDDAIDRFKPDIVMFARNGIPDAELWRDDHWVAPCSAEFHDWSFDELSADATRVTRAGAKLLLVTSVPSAHSNVSTFRPAEYAKSVECGNQVFRDVAAAHPGVVQLVDLYAHLCDREGRCETRLPDGMGLRIDGTHFRYKSARVISQWILSEAGVDTTFPD